MTSGDGYVRAIWTVALLTVAPIVELIVVLTVVPVETVLHVALADLPPLAAAISLPARTIDETETVMIAEIATETSMTDAALAALPTALTGASDWSDTMGAERRIGLVHAVGNYAALGIYGLSYLARRKQQHGKGKALALVGAGLLAATGYLGGHLSYAYGVGVDTTAFQGSPDDWTDVAADAEVQEGKARLGGNVHIIRGANQLSGADALFNTKTGIATLLAGKGGQVSGIVVPSSGAKP